MSEYAYSNKLKCIVSIDFALSPMGRQLLNYKDENRESQNFVCPYPNCKAQMFIRGWKIIAAQHRSPQKQSFAKMGRLGHIDGCTVKSGTFKLSPNEINDYSSIVEKTIKTKYILQGLTTIKQKVAIDNEKKGSSTNKTVTNHNIHGLLGLAQTILDPTQDQESPREIIWRKPKNILLDGMTGSRSLKELVNNLFQEQETTLTTNKLFIYFGYAKFEIESGMVIAKIKTKIQSDEGNPYITINLISLNDLNEQSKQNENAGELKSFLEKNTEYPRVFCAAGYLQKNKKQNSYTNKVFYELIPYSDSLSDSFVFLGDSLYSLSKPYFEKYK